MTTPTMLERALLLLAMATGRKDGVSLDEAQKRLSLKRDQLIKVVDTLSMIGPEDGAPDEYIEAYIEEERVFVALSQRLDRILRLSAEETLALMLALSPLRSAPFSSMQKRAEAMFEKLESTISKGASETLPQHQQRFGLSTDTPAQHTLYDRLATGIDANRSLEVEYYSASRDAMNTRILRPCGFLFSNGHWYVVSDENKSFRLDRFRAAKLLDETFSVPDDFSLERFRDKGLFSQRPPLAATLFDHAEARIRHWHFTSSATLFQWLRTKGGRFELREPQNLAKTFAEETNALLVRYQTTSTT